ncbi:M4 family metallopeptidase [Modicisalibacter coralii]|uniref:M4 family metallopeptidase n=1 Tax=Modicisalibacter coralii TaxID=2304602 RepID=UPI00100A47C7|nr:M4 family metallopeptidase [Halomonas coralii]
MIQPYLPNRPRGFMPPYVLERLSTRGGARLQRCARETLIDDQTFRAARVPRDAAADAVLSEPSRPGEPARFIHSAGHARTLPGTLVLSEGEENATGDPAVGEAYRWLGATYRFFWEVFERHSIDGRGMPLIGSVHFGRDYDNAFWNGSQMVFGDGDGELFRRFTVSLDVVAHELAHGVTEREAGLIYADQSGALNESLSDVFGALTKQYQWGQTVDRADWLVGAELLTERVQGRALRSMAEPGTAFDDPVLGRDPQPGHMRDFVETREDNGGVHINSGIPNRAFHRAAMAIGGYAWRRAGLIWYDTLRDHRLGRDIDFAGFAALTLDNADRRYGRGSQEEVAVREAWQAVGVMS